MKVIFTTNFRPKTEKYPYSRFWEKYQKQVYDFRLIWRHFCEYPKSRIFFKNLALWLFYFYSPLTSCKKSKQSLRAVAEKMALPTNQPTNQSTNQPTNYYQQHRFYKIWLTPIQKHFFQKNTKCLAYSFR